ncbi:hypothetical protein T10_13623 [Trichinella papuae]|uniref:Uncharacterized protein n=1 Tax=Trichinella papuae TaxID=268474 RepID=A0A0V1MPR4_9BILA|nr:hypothetical protein T10_13623 [Trichinella papuae]
MKRPKNLGDPCRPCSSMDISWIIKRKQVRRKSLQFKQHKSQKIIVLLIFETYFFGLLSIEITAERIIAVYAFCISDMNHPGSVRIRFSVDLLHL